MIRYVRVILFEINRTTSNRCPMNRVSRTKELYRNSKVAIDFKVDFGIFYLFIFNSNVRRIEMP